MHKKQNLNLDIFIKATVTALISTLFISGCLAPGTAKEGATEIVSDPGVEGVSAAPENLDELDSRLDPLSIPKFTEPLLIPPVMPSEGRSDRDGTVEEATEYRIAVRQFEQQVLPLGFPKTTVWGYGRAGDPLPGNGEASTFSFPAFTVEARSGERIRVEWINQLVIDPGNDSPVYLPHLLPVDPTLHWANPFNGVNNHDTDSYEGPVPIVTHLHGAHVPSISDGYPEAWYLPDAGNLPENILTQGPNYGTVLPAQPGSAIFEYSNDQRAMTLWYHDHTMGITRLNVYAGLAGFWLIRDEVEDELDLPGPAPQLENPEGPAYEIPIVLMDRSFNEDGSLFYPESREYFDGYEGPYRPESDIPPAWNPEFFGDTIVVNGRTWPYLEVEPRLYRFRFLNGANSRTFILKFNEELIFHQIGNEGGLLPGQPLELEELLMVPAERADVLVDFSKFDPGDQVTLLNQGPDSPFSRYPAGEDEQADPETTGLVMEFRIVDKTDRGNPGSIPESLPSVQPLISELPPRNLVLTEEMQNEGNISSRILLGTAARGGLSFSDEITEDPLLGDTEIWRLVNLTGNAHPIHLHMVHFQVLDRTYIDADSFMVAQQEYQEGERDVPPDPMEFATKDPKPTNGWEAGWKDTVSASPWMVTRVVANFDLPGLYVWHCHILEHEDNEMMRPFLVRTE